MSNQNGKPQMSRTEMKMRLLYGASMGILFGSAIFFSNNKNKTFQVSDLTAPAIVTVMVTTSIANIPKILRSEII
jgi:hypothetical protein